MAKSRVTRSTRKMYRKRTNTSKCRKVKRSAVCKRTPGCKVTKKTTKKPAYCRKTKNHKK